MVGFRVAMAIKAAAVGYRADKHCNVVGFRSPRVISADKSHALQHYPSYPELPELSQCKPNKIGK